jgi:hypothetical protein
MVTNQHEIVLGASPDEVFAWISDLDQWRRWRACHCRQLLRLRPPVSACYPGGG